MVTDELLEYIRQQHTNGNSFEDIRSALIGAGWREDDVDEAFHQIRQKPHELSLATLTELFQQVLEIYRKRWKTLVGIILLANGVSILVLIAGAILLAGTYQIFKDSIVLFIPVGFMLIGVFFVQIWQSLALIDAFSVDHGGVVNSYHRTKARLVSYVWINVLQAALVWGGFLLFVIPGVIFSIWFLFAPYIFLLEGEKGMHALLKSREYVRHLWWQIAWLTFIGGICISLFSLGVTTAPALFIMAIDFLRDPASIVTVGNHATTSSPAWFSLAVGLMSVLASVALAPIPILFQFVVYQRVKEIKGQITLPEGVSHKKYYFIAAIGILIFPLFILLAILVSHVPVRQEGKGYTLKKPETIIRDARSDQDFYAQGRDSRRLTDQQDLAQALKEYMTDHGEYPSTLLQLSPQYMMTIPQDPNEVTFYGYASEGKMYRLCVTLELKGLQCIQGVANSVPSPVIPWEQIQRDRIRDSHLLQLSQALEQYFLDEKDYPLSLDMLVPQYILRMPMDPKTNRRYTYTRTENEYGILYEVCADFETRGKECLPAG